MTLKLTLAIFLNVLGSIATANGQEAKETDTPLPGAKANPASLPTASRSSKEARDQQVQKDLATLQSIVAQDAGHSVNEQLTQIGLKYLPEVHTDTKKWGKTKEFKTLLPRSEPLVLNHGTWIKYQVKPIDPASKFRIRLKNLRSESAKIFFTLQCDAALELEARQAKWVRGVQLYSINAVGDAELTLSLDCEVKVTFDFAHSADMVITPKILTSDIAIHDFRIHRVSKVGGEVSQQITRAARDWLDDHEAEHEQKLVNKLNQQIEKNQDKLRVSLNKTKSLNTPNTASTPTTASAEDPQPEDPQPKGHASAD